MTEITGIKACVFDAYGTLFDVNAAAAHLKDELGGKDAKLAEIWRLKQLQYSWLRTLMEGCYVEFWQVTQDGLDFAMEAVGLKDDALRKKLLDLYWKLDCYPEVPAMLQALKDGGLATAILSNGSPAMLDGAVQSSGIGDRLDAVLSVDEHGFYKPRPEIYEMVTEHFAIAPQEVCFMSSNGWDAAAAAHFGFQVCWVNRTGQPQERLPGDPKKVLNDLSEFPPLLGL